MLKSLLLSTQCQSLLQNAELSNGLVITRLSLYLHLRVSPCYLSLRAVGVPTAELKIHTVARDIESLSHPGH